jgi:uncharacterized protein (TIGR03067 family)
MGCVAVVLLATLPTSIQAQAPAAPAQAAVDAEAELKLLQGAWEGVEKGQEDAGKCNLTITDKTVSFVGAKPQEWYKGTIELRVDKNPKQLDGTITACPAESVVGKVSRAIYKLEGDTLTLVGRVPGAPDSPKSFDDAEQTRTFVLKRVTK